MEEPARKRRKPAGRIQSPEKSDPALPASRYLQLMELHRFSRHLGTPSLRQAPTRCLRFSLRLRLRELPPRHRQPRPANRCGFYSRLLPSTLSISQELESPSLLQAAFPTSLKSWDLEKGRFGTSRRTEMVTNCASRWRTASQWVVATLTPLHQ